MTNNAQHWDPQGHAIQQAAGGIVAHYEGEGWKWSKGAWEKRVNAVACLLAAAPELLAACQATASALRSHQAYDKSPLGLVEAAIAKATVEAGL